MQPLPLSYLKRFLALQVEAEKGDFGMEVRGLVRARPIQNSASVEYELAIYCNGVNICRKTCVALPENKRQRLDDLLGVAVRDIALFGFYVKARQTQQLADDYGTTEPSNGFLTPAHLPFGPLVGELTEESF